MLGRASEQAAIERLLAGARAGQGGGLLLCGEPGIGKTALCDYAALQAGSMRVIVAQAVESECELPFAGFSALLAPLFPLLDRLGSAQRAALESAFVAGAPSGASRVSVYMAALELLTVAGSQRPLLAIVDDAHWLDPSSADGLAFLGRRLGSDRVALLVTVRDDEHNTRLFEGISAVRVGPLARSEARALLEQSVAGTIAPTVGEWVLDAATGNPLALVELAEQLTIEQRRGIAALPDPPPVGPRITDAFLRRAAALGPDIRSALLLGAAANGSNLALVGGALTAMGLDLGALEQAEHSGLISLAAGRVRFRHPLVRAAIYHAADPAQRRAAHRVLAECLREDPARRVWHLASAAVAPDEEVARALADAAESSRRRSAHATSARMLQHAASLSPDSQERARRLLRAATSAHVAGRTQWAIAMLDDAAESAGESGVRTDIVHVRANLEQFDGSASRARSILESEAERVGPKDPRKAATILADAAMVAAMSFDVGAGLALVKRAQALVPSAEDPYVAYLGAMQQSLRVISGIHPGPGPLSHLAGEMVGVSDAPPSVRWMIQLAALDLMYAEQFDESRALLDRIVHVSRYEGALDALVPGLSSRADLGMRLGRWALARADAHEACVLAGESGQRNVQAWAMGVLAWEEAAAGEEESCRSRGEEALALARAVEFGAAVVHVEAALGMLELGLGAFSHAADRLERVRSLSHAHDVRNPNIVRWAGDLIEAHLRAGHCERAQELITELAADSAKTASAWGQATALRLGSVLNESGPNQGFADAAEAFARLPSPLDEARTRLDWGEALRRVGQRTAAAQQLGLALDQFEHLGAEQWAARTRRELAARGHSPRARGQIAIHALTPQELQVAILVSQGATNRETAAQLFLSTRTVDAHLRSIYGKLGIHRRSELARYITAQELRGYERPAAQVSAALGPR